MTEIENKERASLGMSVEEKRRLEALCKRDGRNLIDEFRWLLSLGEAAVMYPTPAAWVAAQKE